jgi:hypothetical protein
VGEFQGEFLDLGIAPVDFRGAEAGLFDQTADPCFHPEQEFRRGVEGGKFSGEIHAEFYHETPRKRPENTV